MRVLIIALISLLIVVSSCINDRDANDSSALRLADEYMITNPREPLEMFDSLAKNDVAAELERLNLAIDMAKRTNAYEELALLYGCQSQAYYMLEDYQSALRNINEAMLYNKYASHRDAMLNLNFKGRILIYNNMLDSAQYYIEEGRDDNSLYSMSAYYECMSLLKRKQGDLPGAIECEQQRADCLVKIISQMERDKLTELDKRHNRVRTEAENRQLKNEIHQKGRVTVLLVFVGIIAISLYINYHRKRARTVMQQQINRFSDSMNQMQEQEKTIMAERLKAHVKAVEMAQSLEDREQELMLMREMLGAMQQQLLQQNGAVKKIHEILEASNNPKKRAKIAPLTADEINELITAVNNNYDGFTDKLTTKYPALTDTDVYMCCLMKLGLDNPGLCAILDLSDNTLRKRKHRLKKEKIDPSSNFSTLEEAVRSI